MSFTQKHGFTVVEQDASSNGESWECHHPSQPLSIYSWETLDNWNAWDCARTALLRCRLEHAVSPLD